MLPEIVSTNDNITMTNTFLGLNRTNTVTEGEFANTRNVTNDYYPVLANRTKRGIMTGGLKNCKAMLGGEVISYVAKEGDYFKLFYNEKSVCTVSGSDNTSLIMMGAYLCVFPDGIIYNTSNGNIETVENTKTKTGATFTASNAEGLNFENVIVSSTAPSSPSDGTYWSDTSQSPAVLKVYSSSYSMWQSVATAYTKISATGIGEGFNYLDSVSIDGLVKDASANTKASNAHYIIYSVGADYIVIAGKLEKSIEAYGTTGQPSAITISRPLPKIDYVCELDNRLWACTKDSHEIMASKLGDPKNWYCYAGLTSDSYAVSVGTQGDFTGCASYNGSVYFFKESGYHKILGSRPSNYEMIFKATRGVQLGSEKSIAHVGDYLFYKAKDAVVLFDGSTNVVSDKLGTDKLFDAVGAGYRDKYYVCMRDSSFKYYMFVYDTRKATWVVEDEIRISQMANTNKNGLYICKYADNNENNEVWTVNDEKLYVAIFPFKIYKDNTIYSGIEEDLRYFLVDKNGNNMNKTVAQAASQFNLSEEAMTNFIASRCYYPASNSAYKWFPGYLRKDSLLEDDIEWSFETGDIGMNSPFNKYIKRIILRMMMDYKSKMLVEVMYDDLDEWEIVADYRCTKKRTIELPLQVRRCDHLKLRFTGHGNFKLYSIAKATEEGSGS